jgi:polysaccharide pyruvyl transferase WcaK-like protein
VNILILGWFGHNNFGDELILDSMLRHFASEKVLVLSDDASHTMRTHGVPAMEWRRWHVPYGARFSVLALLCVDWPRLLIAFRKADWVIVGGGGLWNDRFPLNILYYVGLPLMAVFLGKHVTALGVGVDSKPRRTLSKVLLRLAGMFFSGIHVRDKRSQRYLSDLKVRSDVLFDLATLGSYVRHKTSGNLPIFAWAISPPALARLDSVKPLLELKTVKHVFISCFDPEDIPAIRQVTQAHECEIVTSNMERILQVLSSADTVLSSRLHPLIVAAQLGIRTLALARTEKIVSFLDNERDEARAMQSP